MMKYQLIYTKDNDRVCKRIVDLLLRKTELNEMWVKRYLAGLDNSEIDAELEVINSRLRMLGYYGPTEV
jgi:hypothetical protein